MRRPKKGSSGMQLFGLEPPGPRTAELPHDTNDTNQKRSEQRRPDPLRSDSLCSRHSHQGVRDPATRLSHGTPGSSKKKPAIPLGNRELSVHSRGGTRTRDPGIMSAVL